MEKASRRTVWIVSKATDEVKDLKRDLEKEDLEVCIKGVDVLEGIEEPPDFFVLVIKESGKRLLIYARMDVSANVYRTFEEGYKVSKFCVQAMKEKNIMEKVIKELKEDFGDDVNIEIAKDVDEVMNWVRRYM